MDKREFIKTTGAAALLLSLGISLESCTSETVIPPSPNNNGNGGNGITIDLNSGSYSVLKNVDGWLLDQANGLLLVNVSGNINAFSNVCPHQGCTTAWSYAATTFTCGCHGAQFSNTGSLISGPAQSGLTQRTVSRQGDILTIS